MSGTLTVTDSTPERSSASSFSGGSIQGGRSDDAAGLVYVDGGTFVMQGGTLYNGGTDVGLSADLVVDDGVSPGGVPSTVVRISPDGSSEILRPGPISF